MQCRLWSSLETLWSAVFILPQYFRNLVELRHLDLDLGLLLLHLKILVETIV